MVSERRHFRSIGHFRSIVGPAREPLGGDVIKRKSQLRFQKAHHTSIRSAASDNTYYVRPFASLKGLCEAYGVFAAKTKKHRNLGGSGVGAKPYSQHREITPPPTCTRPFRPTASRLHSSRRAPFSLNERQARADSAPTPAVSPFHEC